MEKIVTTLNAQTHPEFAKFLDQMKITTILHPDGLYEFMAVKSDGSWMNGYDFTTEKGALNACLRKLHQGRSFAQPLTGQQIENAMAFERMRGIGTPSHELQAYLNKWDKVNKAK